jgi:hypothetical protein
MAWTRAEIEQHIEGEPRLGLTLTQYFVSRSIEFQDRIQNMVVYNTPERVMLVLLQLAMELGTPPS